MNKVALSTLVVNGCSALALAGASGCAMATGGLDGDPTSLGATTGTGAGVAVEGDVLVAREIAVGRGHTCALLADAKDTKNTKVACWGQGDQGQLGDGLSGKDHSRPTPQLIPDLSGVTAIRAGGDTTCVILGDGAELKCWGDGAFGQLGNGKSGDGYWESTPVTAVGGESAVDLSVAGPNVCAALRDGTVRCWGQNDADDQLGFHSADCGPYLMPVAGGSPMLKPIPCEAAPKVVGSLASVAHVAAGGSHSCALLSKGTVSCWGTDSYGQLGDGMSGKGSHSMVPAPIADLASVRSISVGRAHSCAVLSDTRVVCFGDNSFGQLGIGTDALDSYKSTPTPVPDLTGVVELHSAAHGTCAVLKDETVRCWGDLSDLFKNQANLMNGKALRPTLVPIVAYVASIRASESHACVRRKDGTVICWGLNAHGEVGTGSVTPVDYDFMPVMF